jgi:hypothetical protein
MGAMIMTVRAHDAHGAMYRVIRPAPGGAAGPRILARRCAMMNNGHGGAADASVTGGADSPQAGHVGPA